MKLYGPEAVKSALQAIVERLNTITDPTITRVVEWWGIGLDHLKTHAVLSEKTCSAEDILGREPLPPDKVPVSVAELLSGLCKTF